MIRCTFTDYIVKQGKHIYRYVKATWPKTRTHDRGHVTVYRQREDGKEEVRHLAFAPMMGYAVFEDMSQDNEWAKPIMNCAALRTGMNVFSGCVTEEERESMEEAFPGFKWTLQKAGDVYCAKAMKLLQEWVKDSRVELLVGAGFDNLVGNGTFSRMTKEKQKQVLAFVRDTEGAKNWTLQKVLFAMKGGDPNEYDRWKSFRDSWGRSFSWEGYNYLKAHKGENKAYYHDYFEMAKECGHDMKDPYWYAPKNLQKAHDKVLKEVERVREARRERATLELIKKQQEEEKTKFAKFRRFAKRFQKLQINTDGFKVYVPGEVDDIVKQAEILHQCLISCDYIRKMASRRSVLVFITNDKGKRIATAEIMPDGKVGQFYGDERSEKKLHPGKQAQAALDKWVRKFKRSKIKFRRVA